MTPALSSIMRNRRVQFLPVQWRTSFQLDADEERRRGDAGLDNDGDVVNLIKATGMLSRKRDPSAWEREEEEDELEGDVQDEGSRDVAR